jgi:hypothetical protein
VGNDAHRVPETLAFALGENQYLNPGSVHVANPGQVQVERMRAAYRFEQALFHVDRVVDGQVAFQGEAGNFWGTTGFGHHWGS